MEEIRIIGYYNGVVALERITQGLDYLGYDGMGILMDAQLKGDVGTIKQVMDNILGEGSFEYYAEINQHVTGYPYIQDKINKEYTEIMQRATTPEAQEKIREAWNMELDNVIKDISRWNVTLVNFTNKWVNAVNREIAMND